jgi:hypothetical protein
MAQTAEEKNKAIVREAFETPFNKRDYEAAERYWSPNYIQHSAPAAPDANRPDRSAAAGQQQGVEHRPRWRQARADQADMPAHGQGLQRFSDRPRSTGLDDAIDTAAIGQFTQMPLRSRAISTCATS